MQVATWDLPADHVPKVYMGNSRIIHIQRVRPRSQCKGALAGLFPSEEGTTLQFGGIRPDRVAPHPPPPNPPHLTPLTPPAVPAVRGLRGVPLGLAIYINMYIFIHICIYIFLLYINVYT